jgi:D-amino peptidase
LLDERAPTPGVQHTMKVFVSVDMEGISGLVRWADVSASGIDFACNRRLMTLDANAAVDGAFAAGPPK